jgi:serine phosphatase RsbU (regulator of sigma subunit)
MHCRVELIDDDLHVTDLGSTNGTFVDGGRIANQTKLRSGTEFRIGGHTIGYERRLRGEFEEMEALERDLQSASRYVQLLLPQPVREGPVRADWHFLPCARIGGDAFGYGPIDEEWWGGFILDVTGHGASAALHAVTVLDVLRRRALPGVELRDPAAVVASLNEMFQADSDEVPLFSMWAFTYHLPTRRLKYCSAGHHPGILVSPPEREPVALTTPNALVGMIPGRAFAANECLLPAASRLYLFSDGVFEISTADGKQLTLEDFVSLLRQMQASDGAEPQEIYRRVRALAKPGPLADDFSIVALNFP